MNFRKVPITIWRRTYAYDSFVQRILSLHSFVLAWQPVQSKLYSVDDIYRMEKLPTSQKQIATP